MNKPATPVATLVIICRRPSPGIGKQRLARVLGTGPTQALGELLLATALEDADAWPGPVAICPAHAEDRGWASGLLARQCVVVPQPAGNLGERLTGVDRTLRDLGHRALIFIGSDAPMLGPDNFAAARSALASHDVVLGPARDGGVTLMGSNDAWPDLADLPWSTAGLKDALARRCRSGGRTIADLAASYDVDLPEDLPGLCADLARDLRPARQRLYHWLGSLGYSPPWHGTTNP